MCVWRGRNYRRRATSFGTSADPPTHQCKVVEELCIRDRKQKIINFQKFRTEQETLATALNRIPENILINIK